MTLEERIKQMLEESTKPATVTQEVIAEREREDDEGYARTKDADDAYNKKTGQVPSKFKAPMKKKSITEQDLEAMTQEELDSLDEEQLDEVSKNTLSGYVSKIGKNIKRSAAGWGGKVQNAGDGSPVNIKTRNVNLDDESLKLMHGNLSASEVGKHSPAGLQKKVVSREMKKRGFTSESSEVSSQVASLLEAEGLSEEFKVQAVTIFEAAVTDRVMQLQEDLEAEYNEKLDEALSEVEINIDGFLNEAVAKWAENNEVAIQSNFKTRLAESFMDGLQSLLAEHNIDLPTESESALDIALDEVSKLQEDADQVQTTISELQEQVAVLKSEKILESFKDRMAATEFDRFSQLTESIKFVNENQYAKQLNIILENFGKKIKDTQSDKETMINESTDVTPAKVVETFNSVQRYAQFMSKQKK